MSEVVKLSGKMLAFSRLVIDSDDIDAIIQAVSVHKNEQQVPVVIHSEKMLDLSALKDRLWSQNIAVIGVAAGVLDEQAVALKLAIFPEGRISHLDGIRRPSRQADLPTRNDIVHAQLVRSGQAVHHMGGDLVVLNDVNHGAEVVTDGNLHIYGKAQGRIVAGATGDESAYIICQQFEPMLVSVAGTYCIKDDIPKEFLGKAVWVHFSKERGLIFELIA